MIHNLRIIEQIPIGGRHFHSKIKLSIITEKNILSRDLKLLKSLEKTPITIYEKPNKKNQKLIHTTKYTKESSNLFTLWITADGGIPIKRFVEGPNVSPNISKLLETKCTCKEFDFLNVVLKN